MRLFLLIIALIPALIIFGAFFQNAQLEKEFTMGFILIGMLSTLVCIASTIYLSL